MKKSVMYSETRTWFFDLDMAEGVDLDEVMSVLKGTDGFYRYVDDGTSEEIECEWSEVPEDWRGRAIRIIPRSSARLPRGSLMGRKGIWYCLRS